MTRTEITSLEISKTFGITHKYALELCRNLIDYDKDLISKMIVMGSYKSDRGKVYPLATLTLEGFCLLADGRCFSRGERSLDKARILNEFGQSFSVISKKATRGEDEFHSMLCRFFSSQTIVREFPIAGYRIDFYMPEAGLFIEFDEESHFSKTAKAKDKKRHDDICEYYLNDLDDKPSIIRVRVGHEIEGLAEIVGFMALNYDYLLWEGYETL